MQAKWYRHGKPPKCSVIMAKPQGGTWQARDKLYRDWEKIAGLGSLSHRICHIFGSKCKISPWSQLHLRLVFAFHLCRRRKGTVVALDSLTHLPCCLPTPPPSGKVIYGTQPLSLLHQGLPAIPSCHTHAQQLFWKIALHLLVSDAQTHAASGEAATFPGRCLQC